MGEPGQYGHIMVIADAIAPSTFNPLVAADLYSSVAIGHLMGALIRVNPTTQELLPGLAKSWELAEDKKHYTFHLRQGLLWSDGAPFTADDVVFTFNALFDARYPNRYKQQFIVDGKPLKVSKIDDYTVAFETGGLYAPFVYDLAGVEIIPKHKLETFYTDGRLLEQWTLKTALTEPKEIVGMGAFRINTFRTGERIVYEPNPYYWRIDTDGKRLPYMNYLIYKFVPDANTMLMLFSTGEVDAPASAIGPANISWLEVAAKKYNLTLHARGPDSSIAFIWFNMKPGKDEKGDYYVNPEKLKWFTDKRFRQAILYGTDREGMIRAQYLGKGQQLDSIISPANAKWYNPNTKKYRYDPLKAKMLFKEMGFWYNTDGKLRDRDGNPIEIEFLITEGRGQAPFLTIFQENMKELGIDLKITFLDFSTLLARTESFEYEATSIGFTGGGDPSGGKAIYKSDGAFHLWNPDQVKPETEWEARIDELFRKQEREFDEQKRIAIFYEIQEIISEELPLIFLNIPITFIGIQNRWKNVSISPMSPPLWNLDEVWTDVKDDD